VSNALQIAFKVLKRTAFVLPIFKIERLDNVKTAVFVQPDSISVFIGQNPVNDKVADVCSLAERTGKISNLLVEDLKLLYRVVITTVI
jgi:hypothetical protein